MKIASRNRKRKSSPWRSLYPSLTYPLLTRLEVALSRLSLVLVLVLNEMVLVLEETASSTSTANAEYEYAYEKAGVNMDSSSDRLEQRNFKKRIAIRPLAIGRIP